MGERFEYVERREHSKRNRMSKDSEMGLERICSGDNEEIELTL